MMSHIIAVNGYEPPIVRTGYEYVIAKRNSDMFAFSAEQDGKVISVTKKGIIVEYLNGKRVGVELGRVYGRAEGSYYPHNLVTMYKENDTFKKDNVLVYNTNFYQEDIFSPKSIVLKHVTYAKVALQENSNTYEDSSAITKSFSTKLVADTTKVRSIVVRFDQNIHDVVKIGSEVSGNDSLMLIEDEISSGHDFDEKALSVLKDLVQSVPKSNYAGIIENIEVYYHGELEDMSSSLRELTLASDKRIMYNRRSIGKEPITGRVNSDYRIGRTPLDINSLEIKVYLTVKNPYGVGDKGIFANQLKSVVGEVIDYDIVTENGENVDAIFGFRSIYARIVLSPMLIGTTATLMKVIADRAVKLFNK